MKVFIGDMQDTLLLCICCVRVCIYVFRYHLCLVALIYSTAYFWNLKEIYSMLTLIIHINGLEVLT